jgi:hypothetical protein
MLLVHDDTSDTIQVVLSIIRTRPPEIYKTDHYVSLEMLITVCFVHRIEIKTPLEDDTHNEPEIYKTDHYVSLEMLITVCFVHRIEIKTPLEDDTHNEDKYLESLSASMMLESSTHNIYNTL